MLLVADLSLLELRKRGFPSTTTLTQDQNKTEVANGTITGHLIYNSLKAVILMYIDKSKKNTTEKDIAIP